MDRSVPGHWSHQRGAIIPYDTVTTPAVEFLPPRGSRRSTTIADSYQTAVDTMALQVTGLGRTATAAGTLTVPALGAPIPLQNDGSLAAVASGLLIVTMQ
jgi:hypothetical protein